VNLIPDRINTIIFDLGGVIVDLAPENTLTEFATLANKPVTEILEIYSVNALFPAYETGRIGAEEFRNSVRSIFNIEVSDGEIDRCWNAMLVGIPPEKLTMLTRLKKHFATLVLSNTNSIHLAHINEVILKGQLLDAYVHQAYYSHLVGMRKPDRDIFEYVLNVHSLVPEQTLFLDDNADNIRAAKALGIEALLIEYPSRVIELFKNYA
jgi:putative hydrolase of the HAD superfamily